MVFRYCPVSELACISEFKNYTESCTAADRATHIRQVSSDVRQDARQGVGLIMPTPLKKPSHSESSN
jgi:hypothetical protein